MVVVAMDAVQSIPFAYLRYRQRPLKFAALKLLFIFLNIALNLIYYVGMDGTEVGYAFLFNLVCTATVMVCMVPELRGFPYVLDRELLKRMLHYCLPLLVLGLAGILNQVADKIIFPYVYPDKAGATVQLGIYGAASKIAMIMAMLTQAFRYAYEPFVFGKSRDQDNRQVYAQAMKFFIIFTLLAFLAVMFYLDILKHLIGRDYWEGLRVVPIVMAAEIFMGVYFNLSFWYKLIDQTRWGAWFSLAGCVVLVTVNVVLVPRYGYMACAWGGFAGFRGTEEIPHPLRPEGHRRLCPAGGGAVCGGGVPAHRQPVATAVVAHRPAVGVSGLGGEARPAAVALAGDRQTFREAEGLSRDEPCWNLSI